MAFRNVDMAFLCVTVLAVVHCCCGQRMDNEERDIRGILSGADDFRGYLVELAKIVTGTGMLKEKTSLKVVKRSQDNMDSTMLWVKVKMEELLEEKQRAVKKLKAAAEKAMKSYGPYKEFIDFKDVNYFNAKKVVIEKDISTMDNQSRQEITKTINYLPTKPTWSFKPPMMRPLLNSNVSSIHVPTNIYDKSMKILNGVQWTSNLTSQFVANTVEDNTLTWQYFCSSDGFFRIYPGMQWPRDADDVDTFDCRIRKWYIQAATSPKNILILLDSSGSMKGLRFSIARSTVTKILETLSDEDYFNVIEFSEEPKYVDECFQDTLMPASVDNIRRMQEKIDGLEASKYANFEKALTRAFKLFQKEQFQYSEQCLCNKAIMIITDGAPENYESVFDRFNWPEKAIRVFTFLIGKEVPDNRQTRWMACANKGKFAHISTRADVQENVQKYIKVLSRPLAIQRALHKVWSPVYLDYVTDHSDIKVPRNAPASLDVDYEQSATYEGLGLVMSISMPVFDERTDVGPKEEEPERNLLGVVGTDVRINELMKLIPTYKLGVNGYAFAITNHGYILFHPDYRPFYAEKFKAEQRLKKRPKYNSVEFSEVELPVSAGTGWNKEHPLRQYLLTLKSGGQSMYSVLTHTDGMRRAKERRNKYRFREVADTFKLVFVVPDKYGLLEVKVDSGVPTLKQILEMGRDVEVGTDISKWVYCYGKTSKTYSQLNILKFTQYVEQGTLYKMCSNNDNYDFVNRTLKDFEWTLDYVNVWNGVVNGLLDPGEPKYVTDYRKCYSNAISKKESFKKMMCFYRTHMSHGIGTIWIGTSSGLTRHIMLNDITMNWMDFNLETIKSTYYKRAVDGHEDGYKYVFTGPVITSQKELVMNTSAVTLSIAEIVGVKDEQAPAAVVAFTMTLSAFNEKFSHYTSTSNYCPGGTCPYTCNDTENFHCYLVDNNGYILASNNPDGNGTGLFLGQQDGRLMRALLEDKIFKMYQLTDYQSICQTMLTPDQESSSSFAMNPLRLITRLFFWLISEVIIFLSEWNLFSSLSPYSVFGMPEPNGDDFPTGKDGEECGLWIPERLARYIYCGFVVYEDTGFRPVMSIYTTKRSCEQTVSRFVLDKAALLRRPARHKLPDCATQCATPHETVYEARWLNETNLVFLVSDASCYCNSTHNDTEEMMDLESPYTFKVTPKERTYKDDLQCQILLNYSNELKRVDNTRTQSTLCLDSSNETDKPCGQSNNAFSQRPVNERVASVLLTVLTILTTHLVSSC